MTAAVMVTWCSIFAQAAADKLPVEKKQQLIWLILFVLAAGVTLMAVVMLLMRAWRRNVERLQKERRQLSSQEPDIWKAGGDRLVAKLSPFPKAPREHDGENFDDEEPAGEDEADADSSDLFSENEDLPPEDDDDDAEPEGPEGPRGGPPPRRPQ